MIDQFRSLWYGTDGVGDDTAAPFGGRASGKVAIWSLERSAAVLRASARSPLHINQSGQANTSHQERALLATVAALKVDDIDRAEMQATWLVKREAVQRLLRSLTPLVEILPPEYAAAA